MSKISKTKGKSLNTQATDSNLAVEPAEAKRDQTLAKADKINSLTDDQKETLLKECVADIYDKQQAFFIVGYRLWQIREKELYLLTHKTYEAFCNEKFDFSKSHANRLVQAYLCEKQLKAVKDVEVYVPTMESQVRLIADLKPEQQVEVASEVLEMVGEKIATAKDFEAAREKLFPKPEHKAKKTNPDQETKEVKTTGTIAPVTFDTNLVSFATLREKLQSLYNIFTNSTKKQEGLNLIGKIQKDLDAWVEWESKNIKSKEVL